MSDTREILLLTVLAFLVTYLVSWAVLPMLKKLKASQTVLFYVEEHKSKSGTATMGGLFFIIGSALSLIVFLRPGMHRMAYVAMSITLAYGVIGFLDDYIKIKYKRNEGLKPYQKIIGQLLIAFIAAIFVYKNVLIGGKLNVPFSTLGLDVGWLVIPFVVLIFTAVTNGVNLTDGLDGLAASVSVVYFAAFAAILALSAVSFYKAGDSAAYQEYRGMLLFCAAIVGSLLFFLTKNTFKASVFMGDTGSLALGGAAASVAVFSGNSLYIPVIGIMFLASCISVIMQVLHYKRTKKRIFLMAPLHHHFQQKGHSEPKIVFLYSLVTLVAGGVSILFLV